MVERWTLPFDFVGPEMEVSANGEFVRHSDYAQLEAAALDATRKCMSAWACGEPVHRVAEMIDAIEKLHALVDPLHAAAKVQT